ncbi:hypothetical protein [Sphingobacterium sp. SGR-19]|uniref:hypothetical protein n=1 Tax=Sphingobacterium sp. SGR-19 TaxID=2710886 RepID=UPI0013EB61F8|nr:hypothetical protein [Sphingobacterium sp. SGR-19]NGM66372.1 hypothetical protein [Sphingobacterium sp. SGR-19]
MQSIITNRKKQYCAMGYILSLWFISLSCMVLPVIAQKGKFERIGPQLTATMIQGSMFVTDSAGNDWLYTVVRGEPAHLLGYDLESKALRINLPLPHADGAWDMVSTDNGLLYIPGANGALFKHQIGSQRVEDLGEVLPGQTYVWNLAAGKDNEVFGATYPGCRVFRYHPDMGFSDVGGGELVSGENYVRSLVYHRGSDKLYAGVGSRAHLLELDPRTSKTRSLLPPDYQDKEFVYSLQLIPDIAGGDRLLVLLTSGRETLLYNLRTHTVEQEIKGMDLKAVATDINKHVYYTSYGELRSFDPTQPIEKAQQLLKKVGSANAFWIKDEVLYMLNADGELWSYNMLNKKATKDKLSIPRQPIPIQSIHSGPDGKIWTGGYLAGGHAAYDPNTGITTEYRGLEQTEGMATMGNHIFFGIYPKGRIYRFDTENPWHPESGNPVALGSAEGQSRPFAIAEAKDHQKMFFGMIPEYGKLGGALLEFDATRDTLFSHGIPIADQAISSLVYLQGKLWIGTTISGGLGVKPNTKEGIIFCWDIDRAEVVYEFFPVSGAPAVTGLIEGPDGHLWGVAGGKLFIFDQQKKQLIDTHYLYEPAPMGTHIWRSAFMVVHPSGDVYGTVNNQLFKVDAQTKDITYLHEGAGLLVMDRHGHLYFRKHTDLWRYTP